MSDVINFDKAKKEKASNTVEDELERIKNCYEQQGECECKYCTYVNGAGDMLYEVLLEDAANMMKNQGYKFTSYDMKLAAWKVIERIEEYEQEVRETQEDEDDEEE